MTHASIDNPVKNSSTVVALRLTALACACAAGAAIGDLLTVPGRTVAVAWPPTGIALGALLAWGPRYWPAVLLIITATSFGIALPFDSTGGNVNHLLTCIAFGIGATLQSLRAHAVLHGQSEARPSPSQPTYVRALYTRALPAAALIGVGLSGAFAVSLAGDEESYRLTAWVLWAARELVSVFVFAPLTISIIGASASPRFRRFVTFPLAIICALSLILFRTVWKSEDERTTSIFRLEIERATARLNVQVSEYEEIVRSLQRLWNSSEEVTAGEFREFVSDLLVRYPGLLALEWAPRITRDERALHETRLRERYPTYEIFENSSNATHSRAGERAIYYPVVYVEPLEPNRDVIGFDLTSDPARFSSLTLSFVSNAPAASGPIEFVNDRARLGYLVSMPIFGTGMSTDGDRSLHGYTLAIVDPRALIEYALGELGPAGIGYSVFDGETGSSLAVMTDGRNDHSAAIRSDRTFKFLQRDWRFVFAANEPFFAKTRILETSLVLYGIMAFASVLGAVLLLGHSAVESLREAKLAVEQNEKQLRDSIVEKEVLLREIHHRVKNNLQVVSSLLRLQSNYIPEEATRGLFLESESRIRSMALVHENLYQSPTLSHVDFKAYLEQITFDTVQAMSIRASQIKLDVTGDRVELSIDKAVPCGLIANELVSNCFKHAFPETRVGRISVNLTERDNIVTLVIGDNGRGLPPAVDIHKPSTMGFIIVKTLAQQLKASLDCTNDAGVTFKLSFDRSISAKKAAVAANDDSSVR